MVSRLTAKERECLARWLNHETAKQIALALGVSHHAVEKRLKSARSKLGVSSSIEAAQMVARVDGYGQTVSQSPDLPVGTKPSQKKGSHSLKIGALIMTATLAILAALALQTDVFVTPADEGAVTVADKIKVEPFAEVDDLNGTAIEAELVTVEEFNEVKALNIVRPSAEGDGLEAPAGAEVRPFLTEQPRQLDTNADGILLVQKVSPLAK